MLPVTFILKKEKKKKELLYRQESCYDLLFIDYCYSLFWKDLLISFHSKTDVENDMRNKDDDVVVWRHEIYYWN